MRADRLVAVLLLLQQRGQVTAAEVAEELEVSERTARRDLEALGLAGLPVYSLQGRGGGWRLAGDGRTDLSGLNAAEARALFLLAGPVATTPELRAALRKLVRALPEPLRADAEAAATRVVVDPTDWDDRAASVAPGPVPPNLDALQRAVVEGHQVRLGYVGRERVPSERVVHPLGLAAKGRVWYLVADTDAGQRTFRVDRVTAVDPLAAPVVRPPDFDLEAAWRSITDVVEERRSPYRARGLADPEVVDLLRWILGTRVAVGPTGPDGRVEVEVRGHGLDALAGELAGLGPRVEVLEPTELRDRLATIGADLVDLYGSATGRRPPATDGHR